MNNAVLVFKKYPNRKLYNPATSNYVTLGHIRECVLNGQQVMVVDHSSKRDITKETLLRIAIQDLERSIENLNEGSLIETIKYNAEAGI